MLQPAWWKDDGTGMPDWQPTLPVYIQHYLAHRLEMNQGYVVGRMGTNGVVWVAFQCWTCGALNNAHPTDA